MAVTPISPLSPAVRSPADSHDPAPHPQNPPITATVGGKLYVANVNYAAGEYVAQDPSVFGAEGTGPDPAAAEEAFTDRIDFLA